MDTQTEVYFNNGYYSTTKSNELLVRGRMNMDIKNIKIGARKQKQRVHNV